MVIYENGVILTMEEEEQAEAVCVEGGRILAAGRKADLRLRYPEAETEDLQGNTLLPAFIDAHSHFSASANALLQVDLNGAASVGEIRERILAWAEKNHISPGTWIQARGYDHNLLAEKRHPEAAELEFPELSAPVALHHQSGHMGVMNRKALEALGITEDTAPGEGGMIGRRNGKLTGYLEEKAFLDAIQRIPGPGPAELLHAVRQAQEVYASYGIATVQEGMVTGQMLPLYEALTEQELLKLDVAGYLSMADAGAFLERFPEAVKRYQNHFKIGGYKIFLDGSPQGRTAWMEEPYLPAPGEEPGYRGYGTMSSEEVYEAVCRAARDKMQLLAHCNGDAAAAQYLAAIEQAEKDGFPVENIRPVMVHAQFLRPEQMAEMKACGVTPSFFVAHVWHWGDTHVKNLGLARAARLSPARSAKKAGLKFTFHQDSPVIPPDMLETVWCAVCRQTREGRVLGPEEAVSVRDALKAVTSYAAWQYGEEAEKGSIAPGKRADFLVLDRNPLETPKEELRTLRVLKTIKDGRVIWEREKR